ncbi:hypothetical protein HK102_007278, partial [Quaeritorhiza haematococci]
SDVVEPLCPSCPNLLAPPATNERQQQKQQQRPSSSFSWSSSSTLAAAKRKFRQSVDAIKDFGANTVKTNPFSTGLATDTGNRTSTEQHQEKPTTIRVLWLKLVEFKRLAITALLNAWTYLRTKITSLTSPDITNTTTQDQQQEDQLNRDKPQFEQTQPDSHSQRERGSAQTPTSPSWLDRFKSFLSAHNPFRHLPKIPLPILRPLLQKLSLPGPVLRVGTSIINSIKSALSNLKHAINTAFKPGSDSVSTTTSNSTSVLARFKSISYRTLRNTSIICAFFVCLASSIALYLMITEYSTNPPYARHIRSDAKLMFSIGASSSSSSSSSSTSPASNAVGKAFIVGEFGLCGIKTFEAVFEEVMKKDTSAGGDGDGGLIAGALVWSLRFRSKDGGYYVHKENLDYWAYHHPGHYPTLPSTQEGFGTDEEEVTGLVRLYAARINANTLPSSNTSLTAIVPPKIPAPAPPLLFNPSVISRSSSSSSSSATPTVEIGLKWRGSTGAASFDIQRAVVPSSSSSALIATTPNNNTVLLVPGVNTSTLDWTSVVEDAVDTFGDWGEGKGVQWFYVDRVIGVGAADGSAVLYRIFAKSEGGLSPYSNVVGVRMSG